MTLITAERDPLTKAYTRSFLKDRLQVLVEEARRSSVPLSLILIDLDHFKSVNDAFGHARGDQVLLEFVERLGSMIRSTDTLFRYGGDEFVLVLPKTSKEQALVLANRLLKRVRGEPFEGEPPLSLSLSIGLTETSEADTPESLFEKADRRLMEAKRAGRSQVVAADPAKGLYMPQGDINRLVERESEIDIAHQFLESLTQARRGVLRVAGASGSGKTRFLAEVGKSAHLRGYQVLALQASSALSNRAFGALSEASFQWKGAPLTLAGMTDFIAELPGFLKDQGRLGLVVLVDDVQYLDGGTLDLLRKLLASSQVSQLAVAYTTEEGRTLAAGRLAAPLQDSVVLRRLSADGLRIWLRELLQWEPEERFLQWIYQETGGLPALIRKSLDYLVEEGILEQGEQGRKLTGQFTAIPLRSWLSAQAQPPASSLPRLASFVGRERELQETKSLLSEGRLLVMLGPGGIGKTHLAVQLAQEYAASHRVAAYFVPLAHVDSPELLVTTIAGALNYNFFGREEPTLQLLRFLKQREILLVLDNFEQLLPNGSNRRSANGDPRSADGSSPARPRSNSHRPRGVRSGAADNAETRGSGPGLKETDLLLQILETAPGARLVVTTREPLDLEGAAVVELGGMDFPDQTGNGPLESYSAIQLFLDRARRVQSDYGLREADQPHLVHICRLVEGMPLGIELAAAWAPLMSCREIAESIEANLDFLRTARPEVPERHQSLRAVYDHFWRSLSPSERTTLCQLSLFHGGFSREAAESTAGASFFFLSALVDRALLRRAGPGRYAMHEVLRQYAEEELRKLAREEKAARASHSRYFTRMLAAHDRELSGGDQRRALDEIGLEIENMRAAQRWAVEARDQEALHRLVEGLFRFFYMRNRFQEGYDLFQWTADRLRAQDRTGKRKRKLEPALISKVLARAGRFAFRLSHYERSRHLLEESLTGLEAEPERIFIFNALGDLARVEGDYEASRRMHQQALEAARQSGQPEAVATCLNHLGIVAATLGELQAAKAHFEESLAIWRSAGDQWSMASALNNMGNVASLLADQRQAMDLFEESRRICEQLGDRRGGANALNNQGLSAEALGDHLKAINLFQDSLMTYRELGDQWATALSLVNLAKVGGAVGAPETARRNLREALRTGLAVGAYPVVLEALVEFASQLTLERDPSAGLGLLYLALGHPAIDLETGERARALLQQAEGQRSAEVLAAARSWAGRPRELEEVVSEVLARAGE
jgi:diguanylate cyclase (GGDEF)-like protein